MTQKISSDVKQVFESFPKDARKRLMEVRGLILKCAADDDAIGKLTETLKWGEPAYLTEQTGSGSTIRLGFKDSQPDTIAVYFNCQTTLVEDIKNRYPDKFICDGTRAVLLKISKPLPRKALSDCLNMALKYHLNKSARTAARTAGLI